MLQHATCLKKSEEAEGGGNAYENMIKQASRSQFKAICHACVSVQPAGDVMRAKRQHTHHFTCVLHEFCDLGHGEDVRYSMCRWRCWRNGSFFDSSSTQAAAAAAAATSASIRSHLASLFHSGVDRMKHITEIPYQTASSACVLEKGRKPGKAQQVAMIYRELVFF